MHFRSVWFEESLAVRIKNGPCLLEDLEDLIMNLCQVRHHVLLGFALPFNSSQLLLPGKIRSLPIVNDLCKVLGVIKWHPGMTWFIR